MLRMLKAGSEVEAYLVIQNYGAGHSLLPEVRDLFHRTAARGSAWCFPCPGMLVHNCQNLFPRTGFDHSEHEISRRKFLEGLITKGRTQKDQILPIRIVKCKEGSSLCVHGEVEGLEILI